MTRLPRFPDFFRALWEPLQSFPWQEMLAEGIANRWWPKGWPSALDLPTASGKTACIDIAVWTLAQQAERPVSQRTAPRRIWFVVDRRIVVDEAYARAVEIAAKLNGATDGPLKAVADRLREVSGTERPLAVARLRGGVLHDDGWARLPSQPAVITSTVDQLGSRLLFRGYGRSQLTAPIFAGLAAHDSLILLDEAHCSVPFLQTLLAIERFRGERWAAQPIQTPFAFAILSATPPANIPEAAVFPGSKRDKALNHPVLHDRMRASKPAELVVLKTRKPAAAGDSFVREAAKRAKSYLDNYEKRRIAIILNRVRTAVDVASLLRPQLGHSADVVLLTGRLRPFERDRLVESWKAFLRARDPKDPHRPVVLVSTQCIEVGADFSFDALVTEAASLDALRQRFGRLNRMGAPGDFPATILIREDDTKEDTKDPIYGSSIAACWRLLDEHAEAGTGENGPKFIDFGIEPLDALLTDIEDLSPCLAPTPDAPTLLPAHVDLLCQTSPVPRPEPDIHLFLHGVGRGAPEARIVWRADLEQTGTEETWRETVALCPPASTEALSVPLFRLRGWLADPGNDGDAGDVEGAFSPEDETADRIRPVLLWAGRERSRVVRQAAAIKPNDLVIVPAEYGMLPIGQSEPAEALGRCQVDLWEPARVAAGRPPALRLHRAVLEPWLDCPPVRDLVARAADPVCERGALLEAIDAVLAYQPTSEEDSSGPPGWLISLLREVRQGRVEVHPDGGRVLFARQTGARESAEPDLFADDDDLLSATGQEVSIAVHSESVQRAVEKLARRCIDQGFLDPLVMAACWHDVGKLDERFQLLLRQGDELAAVAGAPLAKSTEIPSSPARRHAIREASGLPQNFRHEMLSLQLAELYGPLPEPRDGRDLMLHLVASHHGYGRPFAPVSRDAAPPTVRGSHGGMIIELDEADRAALDAPHVLASGVSERFWHLTRKYGWWGLAYLEAILRLGDWYGSQSVVAQVSGQATQARVSPATPARAKSTVHLLHLSGLDGSNPLGFLAALGTLGALHAAGHRGVRLHWKRTAIWEPVLSGMSTAEPETMAQLVASALGGNLVSEEAERKRQEAQQRYDAAKNAVKRKREQIRNRGLRGKERKEALAAELAPLAADADRRRQERQDALRQAVPRPELAIGQHIDCTVDEYREHAAAFLDVLNDGDREALDFLAAFASDACLHESDSKRVKRILAPTPFCFITGSGHQFFLDTVRQLLAKVTPERVRTALFEPWPYTDPGLSMRWDPTEDRRYALMDRDPSPIGAYTVWMANLLAYRALVFFPSAPRRGGLSTTAWKQNGDETTFTWPLWESPLDPDTVRSLLLLPELAVGARNLAALRDRGIVATLRARRIKVGPGAKFKINFSPAKSV